MPSHTDDDDVLQRIRAQRLAQLKKEASIDMNTYGCLEPISNEKEAVHILSNTNRLIVHFRMPSFRRCAIMSEHLSKIAKAHPKTRFIEINADEMHFLVAKFKVQVLPCVLAVVLGQLVDKIIGFDELGGSDDFPTNILEKRLQISGALLASPKKSADIDSSSDDDDE